MSTHLVVEEKKYKLNNSVFETAASKGVFKNMSNKGSDKSLSTYKKTFENKPEAVFLLKERLYADSMRELEKVINASEYKDNLSSALKSKNVFNRTKLNDYEFINNVIEPLIKRDSDVKGKIKDKKEESKLSKKHVEAIYEHIMSLKKTKKTHTSPKAVKESPSSPNKPSLTSTLYTKLQDLLQIVSDDNTYFAVYNGNTETLTKRKADKGPRKGELYVKNLRLIMSNTTMDKAKQFLNEANRSLNYDPLKKTVKSFGTMLIEGSRYNANDDFDEEEDFVDAEEEEEEQKFTRPTSSEKRHNSSHKHKSSDKKHNSSHKHQEHHSSGKEEESDEDEREFTRPKSSEKRPASSNKHKSSDKRPASSEKKHNSSHKHQEHHSAGKEEESDEDEREFTRPKSLEKRPNSSDKKRDNDSDDEEDIENQLEMFKKRSNNGLKNEDDDEDEDN